MKPAACFAFTSPVYAPSPKGEISCEPTCIGSFLSVSSPCSNGKKGNGGQTMTSFSEGIATVAISSTHIFTSSIVLFDFQLAIIKSFFMWYNEYYFPLLSLQLVKRNEMTLFDYYTLWKTNYSRT